MRWKLFQLTVVFLVVASNIHWQWTPNAYLAAIIAVVTAASATWLLLILADWHRTRRERRRIRQQQRLQEIEPLRRGDGRSRSRSLLSDW